MTERTNRRGRAFELILFVAALSILVIGCENVNQISDEDVGGDENPLAEDSTAFRVANDEIPASLDPAKNTSTPYSRVADALFDTLVESDPETNEPVPALAESWTVSADNLTYTFHLREAYFSDGTRITANHVVDSWIRVLDAATAAPYAWYMEMLIDGAVEFNDGTISAGDVGIAATDTYTVELTTVGPLPYVITALSHYVFSVVPTHLLATTADFWNDPDAFVGSGPFVLAEYNAGSSIRVSKSETYWDASSVGLEEVVFSSGRSSVSGFDSDAVDWATSVAANELPQVEGRPEYHNAPYLGTYYYMLNANVTPLDDVRVRKALSMAIDREALVSAVVSGDQVATDAIVPAMAGYSGIDGNDFDVATAQTLLSEGGYADGAGFPALEILYNTSSAHLAIAEYIAGEWEENLGITSVTLRNLDWSVYLDARRAGDFDVARAGWIGDYPDPNTFLDLFSSGSSLNHSQFSNTIYDNLIAQAASETGSMRLQTLEQAETVLVTDEQAVIPLYHYVSINLIDTSVWGGWYTNVMDEHPIKYIHLK